MSALLISGGGAKPGTVEAFAGAVPAGWLECNGAAISRAAYAKLFLAIGTAYGAGDGSTTFNLPDTRGEFIRGFDAGRGVDAGRVLGSAQSGENAAHRHFVASSPSVSPSSSSNLSSTNYFARRTSGGTDYAYATRATSTDADVGLSSLVGGTETRPRNVAMHYGIKY